jgi:DnaJ like chaperone protein
MNPMRWTGKFIGGALGAFLGPLAPLGMALGVALGHQYDVQAERRARGDRSLGEQFFHSTFCVMGHVAKADGRVTEREIAAARAVMQGLRLNEAQRLAAIELFTAGKAPEFDLAVELTRFARASGGHASILRTFIEIQLRFALQGSGMSGATRTRVQQIAAALGMDAALFARLEAAMRGASPGDSPANHEAQVATAYRTLEIESTASDAELTRAYRRQMSRHHPDKLKANGLPDSMLEHAKQRTQAIKEGYELLRRHRGMA